MEMDGRFEGILGKYLGEIENGLEGVSYTARKELLAEIRSHLVEKWEGEAEKTEESLLGVINDFGDPREIAADYRSKSVTEARPKGSYPPTWLVLVLTVFLWPAGMILAWISPAWKLRDKIIATLIPVVLTGVLIIFNFAAYSYFHEQAVEEIGLFEDYGLIQPGPVKRGCF